MDLGQDNFVLAVKDNTTNVRNGVAGQNALAKRTALKQNTIKITGRFHQKLINNHRNKQKEKHKLALLGNILTDGIGGPANRSYSQALAQLNGYKKLLAGPYNTFRGAQEVVMSLHIQYVLN